MQNANLSNFCVKNKFDPEKTTDMPVDKSIFCIELEEIFIEVTACQYN